MSDLKQSSLPQYVIQPHLVPAGRWVPENERVVPSFPAFTALVAGMALCLAGAVLIVAESYGLYLARYNYQELFVYGTGYWSGLVLLSAGATGVLAGRSPAYCAVAAHAITAALAGAAAAMGVVCATWSLGAVERSVSQDADSRMASRVGGLLVVFQLGSLLVALVACVTVFAAWGIREGQKDKIKRERVSQSRKGEKLPEPFTAFRSETSRVEVGNIY